jgi:hypothetical protein
MHIPKQLRTGAGSKLFNKARELVFIGYSDRSSSWLLLDPATKEEFRSNEVLFDEEYTYVTKTNSRLTEHLQFPDEPGDAEDTSINPLGIDPVSSIEPSTAPMDADKNTGSQSEEGDPLTALAIAEAIEPESNESFDKLVYAILSDTYVDTDNPTFAQAMAGPHKQAFLQGIASEYQSLRDNKVFSEPMALPTGFKPLDTKMVLKLKEAEFKDQVRVAKARLCARGFNQIHGINFFETFSPVASLDALRMFLTLLANMGYEIDCVDVITAFLLAVLPEEIYISIPPGYPDSHLYPGKVLRLLKTLYGLKQSPMEWNSTIDRYLKILGFTSIQSDKCIYVGTFNNEICYLLLYVDDILIATKTRTTMLGLKAAIHKQFPIKDKGPVTFFLNMHIHRDMKDRTLTLHQQPKIEKLLTDSRLTSEELKYIAKVSKVPASPDIILSADQCPTDENDPNAFDRTTFQSFVGMLLYISITARPDITTAVSSVARFSHNPGKTHWRAVLMILRYLKGTSRMRLKLGGNKKYPELKAYVDSDWAGDKSRKSRTGFVVFLSGSPIIWSSKLQKCIALSSTEAEYVAVTAAARFVIWSRQFLEELGFPQETPTSIGEDNKGCIDIAISSKAHPAVKHIDIRHHFIRERVQDVKDITLEKIGTDVMTADIFTKQLPYPIFRKHRESLGMTQD